MSVNCRNNAYPGHLDRIVSCEIECSAEPEQLEGPQ